MLKEELGKQLKKVVSLGLMGTICTVSVFSVGTFSRKVLINVDDNQISTVTINTETDKILNQVGVKLAESDYVDRNDEIDGSLRLDVKRAFNVSVTKESETVNLKRTSGTVGEAIEASGIVLGEKDEANYPLDSEVTPNMEIVVGKKLKITIKADGESKEYLVPAGNVNDTIMYLGIPLSSEDIVNADVFSNVYEGMEISINRITYNESKKTEEIPFESTVKKSNMISGDTRKVVTEGRKGQKEIVVKETLMDGNVIKSEEISSKIICEPVNEVILEGANASAPAPKAVSASVCNKQEPASRVLTGSATAYTAPKGARTSTGVAPTEGVTVAVNPKIIPYGKRLKIESADGSFRCFGIAQDTGGALRAGTALVDVYMSSRARCISFGRKNVNVYVI